MKKLFWHYVVLIVAAALIVSTYFLFNYSAWLLAGLILAWALLYIPFFNGRRLYLKGLIPKQKFIYGYIDEEFWQFWKEIYFKP